MLRDFAEKNGMFQYEYYVDDGYTGRNFNRPSFQRMTAAIEVCYIEIFLLKHNVRYIAITDGVDSLTRHKMYITSFKNILNDMYS